MARAKRKLRAEEVERRLYELSLGRLRLMDTVLDKAGQRKRADRLRDLLVDWRAYPSRTVHSGENLRGFVTTLRDVEASLREAGEGAAADHAAEVRGEIEGWIGPGRRKPGR